MSSYANGRAVIPRYPGVSESQTERHTPAIAVEAAIVRIVHPTDVGLEFLRLSEPEQERFSQFIRQLLWRTASRGGGGQLAQADSSAEVSGILFSDGADSRWRLEGQVEPHAACAVGGVMRIDDVIGSVRRCIRAMEGYVPGKQLSGGTYIKLNTNENPYPPSPRVLEALRQAVGAELRLYSDPMALRLRETAAELYGCEVDEVIAGNGSDDILTIIFRTFLDAGDVLVTPAPSYTLYKPLSALQDATFKEIPMGPGYTLPVDLDAHGAKVVIIVNPNAPTGVLHARAALRAFLERTQSVVVIDEAYADFAGESAIDMVKEFPHLIVVRTFSKAYALAGMRLGLGFARREVIAEMMKVKDSYNLDTLAIVAGCAALQDQEWLREIVGMIVRTRTWVQQELEGMGLYMPPSRSNFVFPTIPDGRAAEVFEALEKRRILVRYFRGPLVQDSLRISIGTDAEMEACLQALHESLTQG